MLMACAPTALAADNFYWAPITSRSVVYHAMDKIKTFETLDIGQKVKVTGTRTYEGTTWLQVVATNIDNTQQTGYMSPSGIPTGIPTSSFVGKATANTSTHLYCTFNVSSGTMTAISAGTEINVVQVIGDWYLAQVNNVFYGYAKATDFSTVTVAAPTVTAAPTVSSGNASGVTTTIKLLSEKVVSKGRVAAGTKLYKSNTLSDTYAYGQVDTMGDCNIYYRVDNSFYMISTGANSSLYAYVPVQSVNVYELVGMPHYAGVVDPIVVYNPAAAAATTATAASSTGTVTNCTSWVSMRKKADSKSSRLAKVSKGSTVTVLGTSGDYTKITYSGKTGYILSSYIK